VLYFDGFSKAEIIVTLLQCVKIDVFIVFNKCSIRSLDWHRWSVGIVLCCCTSTSKRSKFVSDAVVSEINFILASLNHFNLYLEFNLTGFWGFGATCQSKIELEMQKRSESEIFLRLELVLNLNFKVSD